MEGRRTEMQTTSQQMHESESSDFKTRVDRIMEASRQALLEADRMYPKPAPVDMEHFRATGIMRDLVPEQEDTSKAD